MSVLELEFHGVRGSVGTSAASAVRTGGHTACVEVRAGPTLLLLDAGTGLHRAGARLAGRGPLEITILLSHLHWDHVQGLPYFAPLCERDNRIELVTGPLNFSLEGALRLLMGAPFFPASWHEAARRLDLRQAMPGTPLWAGDCTLHTARLNHADPCYAWRVECEGRSIVYATDTEHVPERDPWLRRLAAGADILVCDAQYTVEEYRDGKLGRGHSSWAAAAELAQAAGVGELVLFHHDPSRTDDEIDEIEDRARRVFPSTRAAREGLVLELGTEALRAAG